MMEIEIVDGEGSGRREGGRVEGSGREERERRQVCRRSRQGGGRDGREGGREKGGEGKGKVDNNRCNNIYYDA